MALPPLYKYLDVKGAVLTLAYGTFKHAKPSDFNDLQDLTVRSIFAESDAAALQDIKSNFIDVLLKNLDRTPTCINETMRQQVSVIQQVLKDDAEAATTTREALHNDALADLYDLSGLKDRNAQYIREINEHMQTFRVFCVTEDLSSNKMWERYAQNGQGIALRVQPNFEKDSKFQLFRKVNYQETRPPLFKSAIEFLESGMFDNQEIRLQEIIDKIIYTKTKEWEYESEYRLAIPILNEPDWSTMPYHSEEIPELYFGLNTPLETKKILAEAARLRNPNIKIFHGCIGPDGRLIFLP